MYICSRLCNALIRKLRMLWTGGYTDKKISTEGPFTLTTSESVLTKNLTCKTLRITGKTTLDITRTPLQKFFIPRHVISEPHEAEIAGLQRFCSFEPYLQRSWILRQHRLQRWIQAAGHSPQCAFENGWKVSDSLPHWCSKGFVFGPIKDEEAKFNGIMTRSKPNGSVYFIFNWSTPIGASAN